MEIDNNSTSQHSHSRTTSVDENVKMSQLVVDSNQTGLLTPPASMRGCSSPSTFSLVENTSNLSREEKQAAKKAAKAAKKEKKKQQQKQQQVEQSQQQQSKGKETLSEQIMQDFISQLRIQTGLMKEDEMSDQDLIERYISVDVRRKTMNALNLNKALPPLPRIEKVTTASTLSPFAFSQRRLRAARSVNILRSETKSEDEKNSLERLINRYGTTAHMGVLDPSYKPFLNEDHSGAIYYKVQNQIAVVAGDPMCSIQQMDEVLDEFAKFRRKNGLGIVFMGVSDEFQKYSNGKKWTTMHFGWDRYLNPMTNVLLNEGNNGEISSSTKRMLTQNRSLLNPTKGNVEFGIYIPAIKKDEELQKELQGVYESWRQDRNEKRANTTQAFITVYDPFSLPKMMIYLYTRDRTSKKANGFAALRRLGKNNGYQLDPYIQSPECSLKGISDLLVFGAMTLLKAGKVEYMSFGFEPGEEMGAITGMSGPLEKITRKVYRKAFSNLPLGGKRAFHEKYRPGNEGKRLYIVMVGVNVRCGVALAHVASVRLRRVLI